jgi:hypothetical protein
MIGNMKCNRRLLAEFEPQRWTDYARLPWALLRFGLAYAAWRALAWNGRRNNRWFAGWGRHDDPTPVLCPRCLWSGRIKNLEHGYRSDGAGDVEASDECPRCGLEI